MHRFRVSRWVLPVTACVASLGPAAAFGGLIAAHSLGRGAAVGLLGWTAGRRDTGRAGGGVDEREERGGGLGAEYSRSVSRSGAATGVVAALVIAAAAVGWWVAPLAGAVAIGAVATATLVVRAFERIGGDALGAIEQVGECLVLVVVSGLAARHTIWWA